MWTNPDVSRQNYNQLAQALSGGQVSLPGAPPAGLLALPDPYDPVANRRFRAPPYWLHDLSLYGGKLYLYFGPAPAVLLFAPWRAIARSPLPQRMGTALFCSAGFAAAALLLASIRRRCFGALGAGDAVVIVGALGLCSGIPLLLQRAETWETCIACGFAGVTIGLAALWQCLARPAAAARWMAVASLGFTCAVCARPSLVFCGAALVPVIGLYRRRWGVWAAALVPAAIGGALLLAYNRARFHDPFDFGQRYQLADDRQLGALNFSVRYLWFNLRAFFFQPVRLSGHFPFVAGAAAIAAPAGHAPIDDAYGIFACVPIALLAFAAPLAWLPLVQGGGRASARGLRCYALCLALAFIGAAGVLCLFYGDCARYEFEFLPVLLILAVVGIWGAEAWARRRNWAALGSVRAGIAVLFLVSAGFNLCAAAARHRREAADLAGQQAHLASLWLEDGNAAARAGRLAEAADRFRQAIKLKPDFAAAYCNLGSTFGEEGKPAEAEAQFRAALRCDPNYVEAEFNLAAVLLDQNRKAEAARHYARARQLKPDLPALPGLP